MAERVLIWMPSISVFVARDGQDRTARSLSKLVHRPRVSMVPLVWMHRRTNAVVHLDSPVGTVKPTTTIALLHRV